MTTLKQISDEETAFYDYIRGTQAKLLKKLTVTELRLLIVHYNMDDTKGAKLWQKDEMIWELASKMTEGDR